MKTLQWERCKDNTFAGYDKGEFVALIKPVWYQRYGRGPIAYCAVWEQAWKWAMYDENMEVVEWGDALTVPRARELAEEFYFAAEELLK